MQPILRKQYMTENGDTLKMPFNNMQFLINHFLNDYDQA